MPRRLNLQKLTAQVARTPSFSFRMYIDVDVGFLKSPGFVKHGACSMCVFFPSSIGNDFSAAKSVMKTSVFCDLHPAASQASSSKFLIIGWTKVTRHSEEVSLDMPDPFCMCFPFVLVFVLI